MKKIMQTKFGLGGNCQSATIATLLKKNIEEVPCFNDGIDLENLSKDEAGAIYQQNTRKWLQSVGYDILCFTDVDFFLNYLKGYYLVAGQSPRGYCHSVIYKDGALWHDPHPEGGGVIPEFIDVIYPIFTQLEQTA